MFSFLRSVIRRARARITAGHIAQAIDSGSGRLFLGNENGEFSSAVLDDEFVLSYLYGAILFSIEVVGEREEESIGYIAWEVYERLFPGYGKGALQVCNSRMKEHNTSFKSGVEAGYREMKGIWDSPGEGLLRSLHDHVLDAQERM